MAIHSVLYIEDDPDDFQIFSLVLNYMHSYSEGDTYTLTWIDNYQDGFNEYQTGKYDICILDYYLGAKSAMDFLLNMGKGNLKTPVIILTSLDDIALDIALMANGAMAYIPKADLTPKLMEKTIRNILARGGKVIVDTLQKQEKRLLYIEDDDDDMVILENALLNIHFDNYSIKRVKTWREGVDEYLGKTHYDVCLLDYRLGKSSGLEMLCYLSTQKLKTPIIMISSMNDCDLDHFATEMGASDFIIKEDMTPRRLERSLRYAIQYGEKSLAFQAISH